MSWGQMSGHGHAYDVNDERPLIFARSWFSLGVCRCLCRANAVNELSLYSAVYSILLNFLVLTLGGAYGSWSSGEHKTQTRATQPIATPSMI